MKARQTRSCTCLPSLLALALLLPAGGASAAYLCFDKASQKKTISDKPCEDSTTLRNTGEGERDPARADWETQTRRDRCKVLVQKANSPLKARAFADLCTKQLDDRQFNDCLTQINQANSPTKLSASVALCTNDPTATERLTPAPIMIQRGQ